MIRKVCVITATRAEYGLLKCLLDDLHFDLDIELQLIVTGTHLSPEFAFTVKQIEEDQLPIVKKIEMLLSSDSPIGVSKSMGLAQISFAEAFDELCPDLVLVLGDRYELLPIVSTANIARIPVAHLNGGEITEGAIDDNIRHSITKLSAIHFTALDEYAKRVIQMGEEPSKVFNVGDIGLDYIKRNQLLSKPELEESIGRKLLSKNLIITYHPETIESLNSIKLGFNHLLNEVDKLEDTLLIFTKANADVGGRIINQLIDDYVSREEHKSVAFSSMGQLRYLSTLQYVDAVVGNSSSGICEAPSFKVPTINIGNRQKGRVRTLSILDVDLNSESLARAFKKIYSSEFLENISSMQNPYGNGESSKKIIDILKNIDTNTLNKKKFHNLPS